MTTTTLKSLLYISGTESNNFLLEITNTKEVPKLAYYCVPDTATLQNSVLMAKSENAKQRKLLRLKKEPSVHIWG